MFVMLLAACISTSTSAFALGFGTLTLSSHLNQKLNANVAIILSAKENIDSVHVALASQKEYRQLGLQWQPDLAHIKIFLQHKHSGRPVVALQSIGAIHAPLLSILLKADKAGRGTYYKHFQLLIDPVETLALRQPVVMPLHTVSVRSDSVTAVPSLHAPIFDAGWARIERYGPVRDGDSLSVIAYRLRRDKRFSNRQVMLSLYEKNPHGFVNGDINMLKQGAWLDVPRGDVVKQYANTASMQKLSQLLAHTKPAAPLPRSPKSASTPAAKPATTHATTASGQASQELRYSGNISLIGATSARLSDDLNAVKTDVNKQFETMHAEMMAGELQMADLGKSVSNLNQSVRSIKQDIHSLKEDIAIIKKRTERSVAESFSNLQLAVFALFAIFFGALLAMLLRNKTAASPEPANLRTITSKKVESVQFTPQQESSSDNANDNTESKICADEAIQLLNRAEESLGKCEYDQAEKTLQKIDSLIPDSLHAAALKAQLFHETERYAERKYLINSISESFDKHRWERFCQLLPSHVWNACFGGELADRKTPDNEKESHDAIV